MKKRGKMSAAVGAAFAGVGAAACVRAFAPWLGFTLKLNAAVFGISALLGAPGVALILLCRVIFGM